MLVFGLFSLQDALLLAHWVGNAREKEKNVSLSRSFVPLTVTFRLARTGNFVFYHVEQRPGATRQRFVPLCCAARKQSMTRRAGKKCVAFSFFGSIIKRTNRRLVALGRDLLRARDRVLDKKNPCGLRIVYEKQRVSDKTDATNVRRRSMIASGLSPHSSFFVFFYLPPSPPPPWPPGAASI